MTDDPLDERLRDAFGELGPSPESARRAREAATTAVGRQAERRGPSRRVVLIAAVAAIAVTAGAAAAAVVLSDSDRPSVPAGPEARAAIDESPVLARAPWQGTIRAPSFRISGSATPAEAGRIAKAIADGRYVGPTLSRLVTVDVPALARCQRLPRRAPCRLAAPPG